MSFIKSLVNKKFIGNGLKLNSLPLKRFYHTNYNYNSNNYNKKLNIGLITFTSIITCNFIYNNYLNENIKLDSNIIDNNNNNNGIPLVKNLDPIPIKISNPLLTDFELIGYGIREVSFLKFQVYMLGLYIAKDDLNKIKEILNSKFIDNFFEDINKIESIDDHKKNLLDALNNPKISNILIQNLLSSGIRFTARICAIRNTDLSHLRDGFIRTIKNNPNFKKIMSSNNNEFEINKISKGLDDLRDIFNSAKMTAKKNSLVFMEIDENQFLRVTVETISNNTKNKRNDPILLGIVKEPLITQLLFESYAGAEKPLIKSVQSLTAENLVKLVN